MSSLSKQCTFKELQEFIRIVYGEPDDRLYGLWDLSTHQQRFCMRSLKGIRKKDPEKIRHNLLISFSWLMNIANRLHVDVEMSLWERFPGVCSYCGTKPCTCKEIKPEVRKKISIKEDNRPKTIEESQKMFLEIYPPSLRSLADAGVHLAEETGEVSEALHNYLGLHLDSQFLEIQNEIADVISCTFGVANSADFSIAEELSRMFSNGCHVCHQTPCVCTFQEVAAYQS